MTIKLRIIAACLTLSLVLVGCSGGGTTSSDAPFEADATEPAATEAGAAEPTQSADGAPTKDEFIAKAVEECQAVNEATAEVEPQATRSLPERATKTPGPRWCTSRSSGRV